DLTTNLKAPSSSDRQILGLRSLLERPLVRVSKHGQLYHRENYVKTLKRKLGTSLETGAERPLKCARLNQKNLIAFENKGL
ncbi:hypothetical protein BUE80_DR007526, partial [Diplocarpon rosae]